MYKITLRNTNGQIVGKLDFPETPNEIRLNQFVDFDIAYNKFQEWLKSSESISDVNFRLNYIKHIANILNEFTGQDFLKMDTKVGDFEKHLSDVLKVKDGEEIDFDSFDETLLTLYTNIWTTISRHKPILREKSKNNFQFEYKGEIWNIPTIYRDALTGKLNYDSLSTAQAIETLEVVELYEVNKKNDTNGSIRFTSLLKIIAILARKENEKFPTTDHAIEKLISERTHHFQHIDMQTVLDVEYFFLSTTDT